MEIGDRVKLITNRHGYSSNPVWGYERKFIVGTIIDIRIRICLGLNIDVKWDNGDWNSYIEADLALAIMTRKEKIMIKSKDIYSIAEDI